MATYLITGGCGFIGSHLADALIAAGHRVRILDDLSTGRLENAPREAELLIDDVSRPGAVRGAMSDVDGCFHLAAIASVVRSTEDWTGAHRINLSGTIAVFDAAHKARTTHTIPVVYASSAAIYGDNPDLPLNESAAPRPLSAYGADKLGCELHAAVAGRVHQVPMLGLRFFNIYGPRQDPASPYSGVISIFARKLARGESPLIYGDGGQTRDFVYVADTVRHLIAGMARASTAAPVYNVCTGRAISVLSLAKTMAGVLGLPEKFRFEPERQGDIRASLGDPRRAIAGLAVAADTPLAVGLHQTIAAAPSAAA